MKKETLNQLLSDASSRLFGCKLEEATEKQVYKAVCTVTRELLAENRRAFQKKVRDEEQKQVYYMSMEFLAEIQIIPKISGNLRSRQRFPE